VVSKGKEVPVSSRATPASVLYRYANVLGGVKVEGTTLFDHCPPWISHEAAKNQRPMLPKPTGDIMNENEKAFDANLYDQKNYLPIDSEMHMPRKRVLTINV
jgi:hypothetical protein